MAKKKHYSNVLGVLILMLGLLAGVILVKRTNDFRNKAKENTSPKYTVCHRTADSWEEMEVPEKDLGVHVDHGDVIGRCPTEEEIDLEVEEPD